MTGGRAARRRSRYLRRWRPEAPTPAPAASAKARARARGDLAAHLAGAGRAPKRAYGRGGGDRATSRETE
ncbi:hypothetical protein GCM10010510_47260 [Streptomyces anandii JCM 4720]|nr:hypothetical protein GCM10010510_47260 [Streptomyces anandii JCM 4720]